MKTLALSLAFLASGIYDYVNPIPVDLHSWFNNQNGLERLFANHQIQTVIELGSWAGGSTVYFAHAVGKEGKVFAIDTWQGSSTEEAHKKDSRLDYLYQLFLSNMKHSGCEEIVIPIRMTTNEAALALNIKADLIYVDADHTTDQVYADIVNWYPHLNPKGVMCGDDWGWKSVRKGVKKAAKVLGKQIETEGQLWVLR